MDEHFEQEQKQLKLIAEKHGFNLKKFKKAVSYFLFTGCFFMEGISVDVKMDIMKKLKEVYHE